MTDKDSMAQAAEFVWRLMERPTIVAFGAGTGAIGVRNTDELVAITFFDDNGYDEPKEVGVALTEKPPRKTRPTAIVTFSSRESLATLQRAVEHAFTVFDKIDPEGKTAA